MNSLKERIEEKLDYLPEPDLYEVLDFVECLMKRKVREKSSSTENPLLAIAGILSFDPFTSEEIDKELYG